MGGASEDSIHRAGRWNGDSLNQVHLTTLPKESMGVPGQWSSTGGDFCLPRAVEVPDMLRKQVFSQVDSWSALLIYLC